MCSLDHGDEHGDARDQLGNDKCYPNTLVRLHVLVDDEFQGNAYGDVVGRMRARHRPAG